jgi:hypothetical protein
MRFSYDYLESSPMETKPNILLSPGGGDMCVVKPIVDIFLAGAEKLF